MNSIFHIVFGRCVGRNRLKTDWSLEEWSDILLIKVLYVSSSFPHSFGDHPQAWQSWRTTSLFQGSLAQEVPGGGQDSLWLPVNLVITVALLAHRLLLRLLPAHCFPRSQPWVFLQFSFTPWLILVLNLGAELMSARWPQAPVSFNLFLHQTFSFQKSSCLSNTQKPFFISLSLSPQFIFMSPLYHQLVPAMTFSWDATIVSHKNLGSLTNSSLCIHSSCPVVF